MTKQELKTLIDEKIKSNGAGAITGPVLNGVLSAIVEALDDEIQLPFEELDLPPTNATRAEVLEFLEVTDEQLDEILAGKCVLRDIGGYIRYPNICQEDEGVLTVVYTQSYAKLRNGNPWLYASALNFIYDSNTDLYTISDSHGRIQLDND